MTGFCNAIGLGEYSCISQRLHGHDSSISCVALDTAGILLARRLSRRTFGESSDAPPLGLGEVLLFRVLAVADLVVS